MALTRERFAEAAFHLPAVVAGPPGTFGPGFPFVTVCPLTATGRGLSLHVEVEPTEAAGLDHHGYVQCELVRSVSQRRLVHRLGSIDVATSQRVRMVLRTLLAFRGPNPEFTVTGE